MTPAHTACPTGSFRFDPFAVQKVPLGGSGRSFLTARVAQLLNVSRIDRGSGSPATPTTTCVWLTITLDASSSHPLIRQVSRYWAIIASAAPWSRLTGGPFI